MRNLRYLAIVSSMAILLAACSSSSPSGTTTAPAKSGSSLTGAPIRLGNIGSYSGANASSLGGLSSVITAWANSVNASGGINGHPVKLYVEDDAGDPTQALQDVKTLVQVDHVQAILGSASIQESAFASYVQSAGVPMIGGLSQSPEWRTNPDFFPSGANELTLLAGLFGVMQDNHLKKFGLLYCAESPQCAEVSTLTKSMSKLYSGTNQVYAGEVAATSPNYDAQCIAAKSAGVDALYVLGNAAEIQHVDQNCAQLGLHDTPLADSGSASPTWLSSSFMNGMLIISSNADYDDTSTPGVAAFRAAIQKYAPSLLTSPQFTQSTISIWAAGKLFEAAAAKADIGPNSSGADIKKGLYALSGETLDGIAPPLTFVPGKPILVSCYFPLQIKGGKFQSPNGNQPECLPQPVLTGINALLGG